MTLLIKDGDLEVAAPTVKALTFENLATGLPLIEAKFDLRARIEISDWELLDFAIQQARAGLEQDGFEITGWTSEAGTGPHIVAVKDGATTRIVVGAARYPVVEPVLDRDRLMSVAEKTLIEGGQLATAAVALAHADDAFRGDHALPLYRGEPAVARLRGLEQLNPSDVFADRAVRIFVSSTFTDFATERELIARKVLPELQRRGSSRGLHIGTIDLRWGVTQAESAAGTTIERCLAEVDAAYPFFLGLIGKRYGSRPSTDVRRWAKEFDWLASKVDKASVTDLEIRYAMLRPHHANPSALLFHRTRRPFFSRAALPDVAEEFAPLMSGLRSRGYQLHAIGEQFADQVLEHLWDLVCRHYPGTANVDPVVHDFRSHRQFGLLHAAHLPTEAALVRSLADIVARGRVGRFGCSSSWECTALAGALSIAARRTLSPLTFEHYPALTGKATRQDFDQRLAEFCRRTTGRVGLPSAGADPASELQKLEAWAQKADRQVLVVVSGTDLFGVHEDEIITALRSSPHISVILTRTNTNREKDGFVAADWGADDCQAFVRSYLARHRKVLDARDTAALLAHPLAGNPSYLRFVCDWLVGFARFETVAETLHQCLGVTRFADLGKLLNVKGQAEVGAGVWSRLTSVVLSNPQGCAETDVVSSSIASAAQAYAALSILTPMLEAWSGRVWRHHGNDWDALARSVLQ